jgi:hypothetical protein
MKILNLALLLTAFIVAAYLIGTHSQRLSAVQGSVDDLKKRLAYLEDAKLRSEARWRWVSRFLVWIPFTAHIFNRN